MTRITPRTCLWPLTASLVMTFSLSLGLTFRSNRHCFAGTCGEWLFPLQARLHIAVWYAWLSISVTVLAVRAFHPAIQRAFQIRLVERKIPIINRPLAFGGLLVILWIISLYSIVVGIWWIRLHNYFTRRGLEGGVSNGNQRLAAIALTGHWCDITMGMAIIPISRHSALASFFKISTATTLTFHMTTAYTLFALVITHGFLYISWVSTFDALSQQSRKVFPVLNPTYLFNEVWPGSTSGLGIWRASLIFTGSLVAFIFLIISITTLPTIRRRHFNIFYFTHLSGILAIVIICLHASTMFYCTAPGLLMWVLDWGMRLYELWRPLNSEVKAMDNGWYILNVPLPRERLAGCACKSPLAHFYIHHSGSSVLELHPFTTVTHLASQNAITLPTDSEINIQFLFRPQSANVVKSAASKTKGKLGCLLGFPRKLGRETDHKQWTRRLANFTYQETSAAKGILSDIADNGQTTKHPMKRGFVSLHLEGPYFTATDPSKFHNVICIVAGTGISGALAIAGAFKELDRQSTDSRSTYFLDMTCQADETAVRGGLKTILPSSKSRCDTPSPKQRLWTRCDVLWSVKEEQFIPVPLLKDDFATPTIGLTFEHHLTGPGKPRLCVGDHLDEVLSSSHTKIAYAEGSEGITELSNTTWVYISGPNAFIDAVEDACRERASRGIEWYSARYDI